MKKQFLLFIMCIVAITMNAQVFVENFATATAGSNLEGYNNWYISIKAADALGVSPKIAEGALFYTGYYGSNIGNVAVLDSVIGATATGTNGQRISTRIVKLNNDTLKAVVGQKIYAAFLVNFSAHSYRSYRDFFTFEGSKTSSSTRGRIFAKINTAGDIVTLTITKNSSTSTDFNESTSISGLNLQTGINHLLIMCYETLDGVTNDKLSLYINPDPSKTEAEQTNILIAKDNEYTDTNHSDYSLSAGLGINLRQRGIGAQIGGIRVGKTWDEVVLGKFTGLHDISNANSVKIIGKQIITENAGEINVYNFAGSKILQAKTSGKIDTSLTRGLYLIKFTDIEGKISTTKAMIN